MHISVAELLQNQPFAEKNAKIRDYEKLQEKCQTHLNTTHAMFTASTTNPK